MKAILRGNPPLPRYQVTWDVGVVLKYFQSLPINKDLSWRFLSRKLAMLLAITAPKRALEIVRLDKMFMQIKVEGIFTCLDFPKHKKSASLEKYFLLDTRRIPSYVWWNVF